MKKKIIAMLTATMCLTASSLCISSVAIAANSQSDIEIAEAKIPSSEAQKSLITVDDIFSLSNKGDALTWSDFEKYEHTDVGSGLIVWEFKIKDDSSKLFIGGGRLEEKPIYISLELSNGTSLDVQKDDLTPWYYDDATVHKGTKQMTLADVKELAKKGDELDWTDFSDYKGKDVGSGLYILEFELEDGYVLSVGGGHLNVKPEYILLSRSGETDGIDIRKDSVEGYLIMTADNTWTVEVKEITGKTLVVVPIYNSNSNDLITLDTKNLDDGIEPFVGMRLEVTFVGGILETYPAQFGNVKKVSVVSDDPIASGDVNNDGNFNISDVVLLQKWLLAVPDTNLANWKAVDFCADNKLDVFDLCLMKRALLYGGTVQSDTDLKTKFPEYYDQETFKGLEVYLWQETDGGYKCGLLMGTNRNKTDEEIIALTNNGATIEEMKVILSSYSINDDMIAIIPIRISEASYEIMDSDFESVRKMFWGDDSVEPVSIAGKIFAYEKEGAGGYCTLSFNENGRFLYSPGKLSSYMDGGDWKIDGDTVSLIGMENKTIYLKITDDTLVYIAEGSDEFPYMDIKDGEKFVIYRPEISADKFQLNSRYSEYGLGDPKVELDLIVSELPEFCYVEDVRLYDEDDNFIGMMSPAMDADIWNYLVDCHVTEECSKTYYTLSKIRCGGKTYLDDVRSEITVNFKATPAP